MQIKMLSSFGYDDTKNYGDCTIIDDGKQLIVYDCGSEELADEVIKYINESNYSRVIVIISHNDSDHLNGVQKLIDNNKVSSIVTLLLLKYVDEIYEKIDDQRKTRDSLKKQIISLYSNIYEFSGNNLRDALDQDLFISNDIKIVGPSKDYFIDAVAKQLDNRESDNIDGETIMNAISVQLEVSFSNHKLLLTGDSNYEAIKDKITEYDCIQLPHHGKNAQAEQIFLDNNGRNHVEYWVSDNTGNSNGGSDNLYQLPTSGYIIKTTKNGKIEVSDSTYICGTQTHGNLGSRCDIFY